MIVRKLSEFSNDRYELLLLLYNNQITIQDDTYVSLSQQEMSKMLGFSKLKVNKLMKELKELDCVEQFKNIKGKYMITEIGKKVIALMNTEI